MKLIGVDIGGTFTDVVFADTETNDIRIHKVPTTPEDPSLGMLAAVGEICEREEPPWREGERGDRIRCHIPLDELMTAQTDLALVDEAG